MPEFLSQVEISESEFCFFEARQKVYIPAFVDCYYTELLDSL